MKFFVDEKSLDDDWFTLDKHAFSYYGFLIISEADFHLHIIIAVSWNPWPSIEMPYLLSVYSLHNEPFTMTYMLS